MREFFCVWAGIVCCDLPGAEQFPFVNDKPFQPDRPAGVYLIRTYADLRTEPVPVAVAKARAAVPEDIRRIDKLHKLFGLFLVGRNDSFGMSRAVLVDMLDGLIQTGHNFYR